MENKYICLSKAKEQFDYQGNSLGMGNDRALFYSKIIGKGRIYRSEYPTIQKPALSIFDFDTEEKAQKMCDRINGVYNDDFSPCRV